MQIPTEITIPESYLKYKDVSRYFSAATLETNWIIEVYTEMFKRLGLLPTDFKF